MNKNLTIVPPVEYSYDIDAIDFTSPETEKSVMRELFERGCAMPDIARIYFNLGKADVKVHVDESGRKVVDKSYPTLTTVVAFVDGSKVTVVNSEHDPIKFDENGDVSRESKETGLVYALVKRMFSVYSGSMHIGNVILTSSGFGRQLNELIDSAYDPKLEAAKRAAAAAEAKAAHEARQAAAKARKSKNPSLAETVRELKNVVEVLGANVSAKPATKNIDTMSDLTSTVNTLTRSVADMLETVNANLAEAKAALAGA
jgi:hypothetical protein